MHSVLRMFVLTLVSAAVCCLSGQTVSVQCDFQGYPAVLRQSGMTERITDVVFTCVGSGVGSATTDLTFTFNFPVTSRNFSPGTEAVLLVGEPGAQRLNDDGSCCQPGPPLIPGTNLLSADISSGNTIRFNNVRLTFSNPSRPLGLRLVNVRGDMTGLPLGTNDPGWLSQPTVNVTAPGLTLAHGSATVGFMLPGLMEPSVVLPLAGVPADVCQGRNATLAANAGAGGGTIDFAVQFSEKDPIAFKPKLVSSHQNVPGQVWNSESGFFDTSLAPQNGYDKLGLADSATRLSLQFSNIPAGMRLFVTTGPVTWSAYGAADGIRQVQGDGSAVSATTTASWNGSAFGIAPVTVVNGSGTAEWEIVRQSQSDLETYRVGVLVAYGPGVSAPSVPQITAGFGPVGGTTVPRFSAAFARTLPIPVGPCVPGVDLTLTGGKLLKEMVNSGTVQAVGATIINRGNVASGPFQYAFRMSDTSAGSEKAAYTGWMTPGLQPGESRTVPVRVRIPLTYSGGKLTQRFTVDPAGSTADTNRANNSVEGPVVQVNCSQGPLGNIAATSGSVGALNSYELLSVNRYRCELSFDSDVTG